MLSYLHLLTEENRARKPPIADNTDRQKGQLMKLKMKEGKLTSTQKVAKSKLKGPTQANIPEMAGVSMPSPISMHIPNIAMKSSTLLAIKLLSQNLPNLLGFFDWLT